MREQCDPPTEVRIRIRSILPAATTTRSMATLAQLTTPIPGALWRMPAEGSTCIRAGESSRPNECSSCSRCKRSEFPAVTKKASDMQDYERKSFTLQGWEIEMLVAECRKDPSANVWAIFQRVIGRLPDTEHSDTWRVLHGT